MEVIPCSRVAHLDQHHQPFHYSDQELLQKDKIRIADTWMDTYRKIFYRRDTLAHFIRQVCEFAFGIWSAALWLWINVNFCTCSPRART